VRSQDAEPSDALPDKLKRAAGGLWEKALDTLNLPSRAGLELAPIRGSKTRLGKDLIHLSKTFKDLEVEIDIEKTGEDKANIRVALPASQKDEKTVRATLKRGDREVSSSLLNKAYVLFEDVPFGHYNLSFSREGVELGVYSFEIRENHHGRR
jgi:hypothetical protein